MTIELRDEETPEYEVKREYLDAPSELLDDKDVVEDWKIGRNVHARNEPQGGNEEAEARQTLDAWMTLNRDEMLQLDGDAIMHGLAMVADRAYQLGQVIREHMPVVVAAQQEIHALSLLKSSLQSILRTLRDISQ